VYVSKEQNRALEMDINNFNLGKYIAYAFNDPKHYPDKPFSSKSQEKNDLSKDEIMNDDEITKTLDRMTLIFKGRFTKKADGTNDGRTTSINNS
jgi:hypothetical protein